MSSDLFDFLVLLFYCEIFVYMEYIGYTEDIQDIEYTVHEEVLKCGESGGESPRRADRNSVG